MTLRQFLQEDRFARATGVELLEVGEGYARAMLDVGPGHLNAGGVCQGGALFTLADLAFAAATNSHGRLTLLTHGNIRFFRSVEAGKVYAEAREVFDHKRLSHCEVRLTDEAGALIGTFHGDGYRKAQPLPFTSLE